MALTAVANIVLPMLAPHHDQQESGMSMHTCVATVTEGKDHPTQAPMSGMPEEVKQVSDERLEKLLTN